LTEQLPESSKKSLHPFSRLPEFKVQSSSTTNNFNIPTSVLLPQEELSAKLPVRFQADKPGIYSTKLSLTCGSDMREFEIEVHCITQSDNEKQPATLHMRTSVFTPIQQNIPIVC
jgi:heme/copper-type cytochrome/quinol oxidase subunit 2